MKIGLSLSGGAARGLIHIGVMEELAKAGIPINMVAGSSIGAVIGALYAMHPNVEHVKQQVFTFLRNVEHPIVPIDYSKDENEQERRSIFRKVALKLRKSIFYGISLTKASVIPGENLKNRLAQIVPDSDFSACRIPFACAATDITNNTVCYFTKGSILDAVTASCSIPGFFPPVMHEGAALVDGDWSAHCHDPMLRRMGAGFVIAVDIEQDVEKEPDLSNGLDIVLRSHTTTREVLSRVQLEKADVVIKPDVCDIGWWDFAQSEACFHTGKQQTASQIAEIKQKIRSVKLKRFFRL